MLTERSRPILCVAEAAATRCATESRIRSRTARPSRSRLSFILGDGSARSAESIARLRIARLQTDAEPVRALRRRAVRERVRRHTSARVALQAVVADRLRGRETLFDVAGLEDLLAHVRVMGPDPREAIGLQLERDLEAVRSLATRLRLAYGIRRAEQVLHVVPDFVPDHVGLRELARPAELREVREERRVEIDPVIRGTVERPDRGRRVAASGFHRAVEERELGIDVVPAGQREDLAPDVLGAAKDRRDEGARLVVRRERRARGEVRGVAVAAVACSATAEQRQDRVRAADEVRDDEQYDHADRAAAAERDRQTGPHAAAALTADVADVVTASQIPPTHALSSSSFPASLTERPLALNG